MAEPGPAADQPGVLRLGGADLYQHHGAVHPHRLYPRPSGGEVPQPGQAGPVVRGGERAAEFRPAGLF